MAATPRPIIQLCDVSMEWERNTALRNVDITVNRGDFLAITGPNGGGKTTLLRIILKLLKPSTGSVKYFDADSCPVRSLPIGYLPQKNLIDSHFPITVREVVKSGLSNIKLSKSAKDAKVKATLAEIGLEEHAASPIGEISGGQLQRTLLGRAIISDPDVLVLDEPLSYLDKVYEKRVCEIVERLAGSTTILLVSHQMTNIASMATRHIIVDHEIHECGASHHMVHYECDD